MYLKEGFFSKPYLYQNQNVLHNQKAKKTTKKKTKAISKNKSNKLVAFFNKNLVFLTL